MTSATSSVTVEKTQSTFATFGILETLVTDNGTNFISVEFEESNGIHYT